jgi:hypothetical protein
MAYYTALIAAWDSATQPPAGVTGAGLTGLSTAAKLAAVNAWTFTGSSPTAFGITGVQIANCINWAEFNALTAQQQSNVLALCNQPGSYIGGSAETAHLVDGMIIAYFPSGGPTMTALTALAEGIVQPWWQYAGYPGLFDLQDVTNAGLS